MFILMAAAARAQGVSALSIQGGIAQPLLQSPQQRRAKKPLEQFAAARFGLLPCQQSLAYDLELDDA